MLSKIRQSIAERSLWKPGEPILVAVSGGPDSVALLDALMQVRDGSSGVKVCHLNHRLRGRASDEDAEFVRELAAKYHVPAAICERDVRQMAHQRNISVEMAARAARLEVFREVAQSTGIWKVALAHTADDQAETVLLRLIRGAGREGLSAMEPLTAFDGKLALVRPMLTVWRREVMEYLRERQLSFREDDTNRDERILRNRVRHKLLPMMESEFGGGVKEALRRAADIFGEEERFLETLSEQRLRQVQRGERLELTELLKADVALQRRMLRRWLQQRLRCSGLTMERLEAVLRLASHGGGTSGVEVGGGHWVARIYDQLVFVGRGEQRQSPAPPVAEATLFVPGSLQVPALGFRFSAQWAPLEAWEAAKQTGLSSASLTAFFDADALPQPFFTLRSWRAGDRFQPLGMSSEKKLQDFFVDEKVPQSQRWRIPLAACAERIAWVVGYRIADWAKVTEKTARVVQLTAEKTAFALKE
jgi:tRNA(Ile)-lysidine synthase